MNAGAYGLPRGRRKKYGYAKFQGARVARFASAQSVASGGAYISWDTVVWAEGAGIADLPAQPLRLTATVEGWWECGFGCDLGSVSGGGSRGFVQLEKFNAAAVSQAIVARMDYAGSITFEGHTTGEHHFYPGEYVQCFAFQSTGGARNVQAGDLAASLHACTAYLVRVG